VRVHEQHGYLTVKEAQYEELPEGAAFYFSFNGVLWPVVLITQNYTSEDIFKIVILKISAKKKHKIHLKACSDDIVYVSRSKLDGLLETEVMRASRRAAPSWHRRLPTLVNHTEPHSSLYLG